MTATLLLAASLAVRPAAGEPPAPAEPAEEEVAPHEGWIKTASSLLLFDSSGTLVHEVGLGTFEEPSGPDTVARRAVRAGVSSDGRFAWSWEKTQFVRPGKNEKTLSMTRLFTYLGTEGQELFRNELADAPEGLPPAALSADGERVLVAERAPDAWIVAAYDFTGNRLVDARGGGALELAQITPNGRFALLRWHAPDRPPEYAYLRVKQRRAENFVPKRQAPLSLSEDGRVLCGDKVVRAP